MKTYHLLSLSTVVLLAAACASGGAKAKQSTSADGAPAASAPGPLATGASAPTTDARRARRSANVITSEELREATQGNVYELVASTRPEWLRTSGAGSLTRNAVVTAYLDNTRLGNATALRTIPLNQARAIRYYPPSEAQSRFGLDNTAGTIQVETGNR